MAVTGAILAVSSLAATTANIVGTQKNIKEQKTARDIQQRSAAIENNRQTRLARQEQLKEEANVEQIQVAQGARANSAVSGAIGSLGTQTASNIGAGNTRLAGQIGVNDALARGAQDLATFSNIASGFNFVGDAATISAKTGLFRQKPKLTA